jgi:hypothetical protein
MSETKRFYVQLRLQETAILGLTFLLLLGGIIYATTATQPVQKAAEPLEQDAALVESEGVASVEDDWTKAGLSKTDAIFLIRGEAVG